MDVEGWRMAAIAICSASVSLLAAQILWGRFLDPTFEVCLFHLPSALTLTIYVKMRRLKQKAKLGRK